MRPDVVWEHVAGQDAEGDGEMRLRAWVGGQEGYALRNRVLRALPAC
jgi:hypothetical protein